MVQQPVPSVNSGQALSLPKDTSQASFNFGTGSWNEVATETYLSRRKGLQRHPGNSYLTDIFRRRATSFCSVGYLFCGILVSSSTLLMQLAHSQTLVAGAIWCACTPVFEQPNVSHFFIQNLRISRILLLILCVRNLLLVSPRCATGVIFFSRLEACRCWSIGLPFQFFNP